MPLLQHDGALEGPEHAERNHLSFSKKLESKRQRLVEEKMRENSDRAFQAYGRPLVTVTSLKCLGQVLTAVDDNWPEVVGNLCKVCKI